MNQIQMGSPVEQHFIRNKEFISITPWYPPQPIQTQNAATHSLKDNGSTMQDQVYSGQTQIEFGQHPLQEMPSPRLLPFQNMYPPPPIQTQNPVTQSLEDNESTMQNQVYSGQTQIEIGQHPLQGMPNLGLLPFQYSYPLSCIQTQNPVTESIELNGSTIQNQVYSSQTQVGIDQHPLQGMPSFELLQNSYPPTPIQTQNPVTQSLEVNGFTMQNQVYSGQTQIENGQHTLQGMPSLKLLPFQYLYPSPPIQTLNFTQDQQVLTLERQIQSSNQQHSLQDLPFPNISPTQYWRSPHIQLQDSFTQSPEVGAFIMQTQVSSSQTPVSLPLQYCNPTPPVQTQNLRQAQLNTYQPPMRVPISQHSLQDMFIPGPLPLHNWSPPPNIQTQNSVTQFPESQVSTDQTQTQFQPIQYPLQDTPLIDSSPESRYSELYIDTQNPVTQFTENETSILQDQISDMRITETNSSSEDSNFIGHEELLPAPQKVQDYKKQFFSELHHSICPKSPIDMFFEMYRNSPIMVIKKQQNNNSYYVASIEIGDKKYTAFHNYIVKAKEKVCEKVLRDLFAKEIGALDKNGTDGERNGNFPTQSIDFPWHNFASLAMHKLLTQWKLTSPKFSIQNPVCITKKVDVQKQFPALPENYYPVQLLNYMMPGTQFTETVINEKLPCFQVKCEVGGFQFTAEGPSMKEAKKECAISVIKQLWNFDFHAIKEK